MVNIKVKGDTSEASPVQLYLAAGESDQATSGHIFMDNLRAIMHGLPMDVPIMVCEDVHAMVLKGALLQRDVNDLSQKQFTAGSDLIIWPGECQVPGHSMSTLFGVMFCIRMLSVLVEFVFCTTLGCGC